jgi:quercetin dioxygenase-like cupin family protein
LTRPRIKKLDELPLERTTAHDGQGEIFCHRPFPGDVFEGPWNFVDYAVLPPGTSIGPHRHGDNEELYLVLEGRGTMHLDGRDFTVEAGHVIVNRRGGTHGLRNDGTTPLRLFVVEIAVGTERRA